jgi:hypothetical protein
MCTSRDLLRPREVKLTDTLKRRWLFPGERSENMFLIKEQEEEEALGVKKQCSLTTSHWER